MNQSQLKSNINITLKDGTPIKCKCGNANYMELIRFFKFSALLTGQPKDSLMPIPVHVCGQCGETLQDTLPSELRESKPKIDVNNIVLEN